MACCTAGQLCNVSFQSMRIKDTVKLVIRLVPGGKRYGAAYQYVTDERFSNVEPSYTQGTTPHAGTSTVLADRPRRTEKSGIKFLMSLAKVAYSSIFEESNSLIVKFLRFRRNSNISMGSRGTARRGAVRMCYSIGVGTFIAAFRDHHGECSGTHDANAHLAYTSYTKAQASRCVLKHQVRVSVGFLATRLCSLILLSAGAGGWEQERYGVLRNTFLRTDAVSRPDNSVQPSLYQKHKYTRQSVEKRNGLT